MQEETPYIAFLLVNSDRIWFLSLDILSASVALIQKPVNWFAVQSYLHSFVHVLSEAVAWRCSVEKVLSLKVYQICRNVGKSSIYIWLYQIHRFTFQTTYYCEYICPTNCSPYKQSIFVQVYYICPRTASFHRRDFWTPTHLLNLNNCKVAVGKYLFRSFFLMAGDLKIYSGTDAVLWIWHNF